MKNDIDSILNSLFSGGRLNVGSNTKSRAAQEAEAFLESLEKAKNNTDKDLSARISDLDRLNNEAQKSMDEMRRLLESDGIKPQPAQPSEVKKEEHPTATGADEEPPKDTAQMFKEARAVAGDTVIGQDAFLNSLFTAFKRPGITGTAEGKPAAVIVISGKEGTGRHSALFAAAAALSKSGVLKNGKVVSLDLSRYASADDSKLLMQDLFSAMQSGSEVLLFENFEKCHKSLLPMIASLAEDGVLQLSTRYALQKGMLIEVGTALVPNAVSEVKLSGQFLVCITDKKDSAFTDAFGAPFLSSVTDFCRTEEFTAESLQRIGQMAMEGLAERAKERLKFTLNFGADAAQYLAAQFSRKDGVESMDRICERCFRLLSEAKLHKNAGAEKCEVKVTKDGLSFVFPAFTVSAEEEKQAENQAAVDEVKY